MSRMNIHESDYHVMRGSGIGSIFSNIFRGLVPLAKNLFSVGKRAVMSKTGQQVMKAAKRTAMDAGLDIVNDVLDGENLKASAKKNLRRSGKTMLQNVKKEMRGGKGAKRTTKACKKKTKKKKNASKPKKKKKKRSGKNERVSKKKSKPKKKKKKRGVGKRQSLPNLMRMWM